ncbi:energy-coupling factor transporter transmembrane protein EcfT [Fulvimarina sp. MAC3]|uniref:energy-coupling factor transporter transmembrane component T family protein n=1 Tax=Fulvimarina sp. MAC3 TaxID=3148887 RepID=UPI0031FC7C89
MIAGLYRPGTSFLHRMKAGHKLIALIVFGTVLLSVPQIALSAGGLAAVAAAYLVAGFSGSMILRQIRPAAFVLAILFAAQLWLAGLDTAVLVLTRFSALILAAALVTLTTRTSDLVAAIETALGPFERFGVNVEKTSLAISLTIRFIPLVSQVVDEVREAQAARGGRRSIVALAVPVTIRLLKTADAIAEAIDTRS